MFWTCRRSFSGPLMLINVVRLVKAHSTHNNLSSPSIFHSDVSQKSVWTDFLVFIKLRNEDAVKLTTRVVLLSQMFWFHIKSWIVCTKETQRNKVFNVTSKMLREFSGGVELCLQVLWCSDPSSRIITIPVEDTKHPIATRLCSEYVGVWWDSWNFQLWPHRTVAAIFEGFVPTPLVLLKCFHSTQTHFWKRPSSHTTEKSHMRGPIVPPAQCGTSVSASFSPRHFSFPCPAPRSLKVQFVAIL